MAPPAPPPENEMSANSELQSNGPSAVTNGPTNPQDVAGNQLWERAWTVDEIRKGAGNWSLAGDAGLLLLLQEFSQRMISRTHEIEKAVDGLVHQAKTSGVRLDNVFNDFIMLANTQFVENRVYDEDVSQESANETEKKPDNEQEKTREQREADLIPKVSEALKYGIKVIEESFETLDMNAANSDSEDEDIPYRADPILEPKDPYVARPLPHIIGTPLFMQEDDVGLIEPASDEETESHGSISESEPEDEKDESDVSSEGEYTESESESGSEEEKPARPVKQKVIHSTSSEESESEGDLFGGEESQSEADEQSEHEEEQKPSGRVDFTSELAAKIGVAPKLPPAQKSDDEDIESKEQTSEPKTKVKKERSESSAGKKKHDHKHRERTKSKLKSKEKPSPEEDTDPFGASPGVDEDISPFGGKGLFSGSKGLFDDDEDSGGLFDEISNMTTTTKSREKTAVVTEKVDKDPPKENKKSRKKSKKAVGEDSLFGGGDDELFADSTHEPDLKKPPPKPADSGGLFEEEDDDLFPSGPKKSAPKSGEKSKQAKGVESLFGEDEDDDLFGEPSSISSKPAETALEKGDKPAAKPKKKLPAGAVSMFGNAANPLAAALKQKLGGGHSGDEDDEDRGSEEDKSRSSSIKSTHSNVSSNSSLNKPIEALKRGDKPSPSRSSNSLFEDEPEDDLFLTKPGPVKSNSKPVSKKASLFDEDGEEDEIFGGGSKDTATKKPSKPSLPVKGNQLGDSLFEGDSPTADEDLFGAVTTKPRADSARKKPIGGVALFGGADLFGKKDKPSENKAKDEAETKPAADIKTITGSPPPRKNTLSLFDDDGEDLFGTGSTKPGVKVSSDTDILSAEKGSKPETKSRSKSKSLFQDEDILFGGPEEENPSVDLFGDTPPVTPQKTASKPKAAISKPSGGVGLKGATTTSSSTDLFGADDDDGDDLFGGKAKPEQIPEVNDGKINLDDATTTETSDEPEVKKVSKPRKPAGGVSLFGGVDPFGDLKKKTKDPLFDEDMGEDSLFAKPSDNKKFESTSDSKVAPKPVAPKPKKPAGGVSMFGGIDPLGGFKPKVESQQEKVETADDSPVTGVTSTAGSSKESESSPVSLSPPSPSKGIGKLKANLMINPAALLPGAAPPQKEAEPVAIGFDTPAEAATLHSETKDRAKIISRRRPPSRKARKKAAEESEAGLGTGEEITSSDSSPSHETQSPSSAIPNSSKSDLFGNDDILGKSIGSSHKSDLILGLGTETESVDDDIFKKEFPQTRDKKLPSAIIEDDEDLFSGSEKKKTKTVSNPGSESTKPTDTKDDLSSGASSVNKTSVTSGDKPGDEASSKIKSKGDKSAEKTVSEHNDDDIFADASILKNKEVPEPKPIVEDDLFSDSILNKPTAQKKEDKFDDEDIFAAGLVKKDKKKKPATKDEDLFKDDTDIFADLPAAKPKEKKKKKSSTSAKKSVFKDDVDDIFADSSAPAKPKKDSEKKKKSRKKEADNIFDDPLNAAGP